MVESDTVKLLRECDAGVKMGISSIEDVLDYVKSPQLSRLLSESKEEHGKIEGELTEILESYGDEGKRPNPIAKGMSRVKTNVKMALDESDKTIADLMTDGCNMGVKSLHKYLNQYSAADAESKGFAKRLIQIEDDLAKQIRQYL